MRIPMRLSCIAFASLRQRQGIVMPPIAPLSGAVTIRLLSSNNIETQHADTPTIFPRWLRLAALAPVSQRRDLTTALADKIDHKSGGYVSNANLLSDMVTSIFVEDMDPQKIPDFWHSMEDLPSLEWTDSSKEQFEMFNEMLEQCKEGGDIRLPPTISGVIQLTWRGAQGKLCHEIPADG